VKVALQTGARFISSAGLIGGGTGSVDFAQSLEIAEQGLVKTVPPTAQNLGLSSGASFFDQGTLIDRLYDRTGIRLLGLLRRANGAEPGVLSLLGPSNAVGDTAPNHLVWGTVAGWTSTYYITWGMPISDPQGHKLAWGTQARRGHLVSGTTVEVGG
jgi:hypothetical protein